MFRKPLIVLCVTLFLLTGSPGFAGNCPEPFIKAMQQEGLDRGQILSICDRLDNFEEAEKPKISVKKIEKDIAGKMVGSWIFQKSEWREIDILDSKYDDKKAKVTINVDTIRNKSGSLRLYYRWNGNKWKLSKIFNIDFD